MKFDRVTITGADDSVSPQALIDLSMRFPFVEWGILYSAKQEGAPRFPGKAWRERLQFDARGLPVNLSLHLCGRRLRDLLVGTNSLPVGLTEGFQRMQLNFHAEDIDWHLVPFVDALAALGLPSYIFQIDGNRGQDLLAEVEGCGGHCFEPVPLFDLSHGAGVVAEQWPQPFSPDTYHGYAGGLGPENLEHEIQRIAAAADDARFWVDMETRVRSNGDALFDLAKVERCLQIADRFVWRVPA